MNYIYIAIIIYIICSVLLSIFVLMIHFKLESLSYKIKKLFKKRTNLIPCLYEITKSKINMADEVFKEAFILRKKEFINFKENINLEDFLYNESLIHHELNFIFKIVLKNKAFNKDGNLLYIRDLAIDISDDIGKSLDIYNHFSKKLNKLITIKNITIIGLLFPIEKRDI